jgi:hypothetical protein
MKKFLNRIVRFGLIFFLLIILPILIVYLYKWNKVRNIENKIAESYTTIIMGDSQMRRFSSYNFSDSTFNYATSAEHSYFTFLKLEGLLSHTRNKINTVIIGVMPFHFTSYFDEYANVSHPQGNSSLKRYIFYINPFKNDFFSISNLPQGKSIVSSIFTKDAFDWGYFASSSKNPDASIIDKTIEGIFDETKDRKLLIEEFYLEKIVNLCNQKNIRLVFVSPPVHNLYKSKIQSFYWLKLAEFIKRNNVIEYYNYLDQGVDNEFMTDGVHLNINGGKFYSLKINHNLKSIQNDAVYWAPALHPLP